MKPFIFIPGIEATALVNSNTFDFDFTWNAYDTLFRSIGTKITGPDIEEKLQEDPLYDQNVSSVIERNHIARLPYDGSIQNLASKYKDDPFYLFGYDWRLSAAVNGRRLADFVGYLKNKLRGSNLQGFRFVTHSMGCYIMGCYLTEVKGNYDDISKVVFCAPPFRGSPYAIVHLVKGDGGPKSFLAKLFGRSEDIRKVVRTYPSLLELTPWYDKSMVFNDGTPVDLTDLADWQSNIWDDIESLFRSRLIALADFRNNRLCDLSGLPEDVRSRMIIIAGSNDNTLTGLHVDKQNGSIKNFIRLDQMVMGSGDGTVPFESSTIFKDSVRTIEVKKENLFAELGDNVDFHGFFLRDSRVQNILGRMFDDRVLSTLTSDKAVNAIWGDKNKDWWESVGDSVSSLSKF